MKCALWKKIYKILFVVLKEQLSKLRKWFISQESIRAILEIEIKAELRMWLRCDWYVIETRLKRDWNKIETKLRMRLRRDWDKIKNDIETRLRQNWEWHWDEIETRLKRDWEKIKTRLRWDWGEI